MQLHSVKPWRCARASEMTSNSNDLEKALEENLKLRSELAANVAKPEVASQRGGMAYRLGWVRRRMGGVWLMGDYHQHRFG